MEAGIKENSEIGDCFWKHLEQRQLHLMVKTAPRSAWHEMALWTEEGRMWPLPVDNEFGCEKEAAVGFQHHVLLERHIEGWCPRRGPIRKFMELVCIGLSKNYMFSVEEKREHIAWFEQYFMNKRKVLEELECLSPETILSG